MAASFASRIDRIEPPRVQLTSHGSVRVRVVGSALGWVRCGRERRWVWGRFDQSFVVSLARGAKATLEVRVVGLGGAQRRRVPIERHFDLQPPRLRLRSPRLRVAPAVRAPRLRPLTQADLVSLAHGSARFDPLPEDPSHE